MFSNTFLDTLISTMLQRAAGEEFLRFYAPKGNFRVPEKITECFAETINCAAQTGASVNGQAID